MVVAGSIGSGGVVVVAAGNVGWTCVVGGNGCIACGCVVGVGAGVGVGVGGVVGATVVVGAEVVVVL